MNAISPELFAPPPTSTGRTFLRRMSWFGVGVGLGLSPFLGAVDHPVFRPLFNLMPLQVRFEMLSLSAFLLGLVALAVDYYAAERVSLRSLGKAFWPALLAMLAGVFMFYALRTVFTESVPRGDSKVTLLVGASRLRTCPCKQVSDKQCIKSLGLDETGIELCWAARDVKGRGLLLGTSYLLLTTGLGGLVGLGILRDAELKRRAKEKSAKQKRAEKKQGKEAKESRARAARKTIGPTRAEEALPSEAAPAPPMPGEQP